MTRFGLGFSAVLEPFLLHPVLVSRPWGGRRLADLGKALPDGTIGESWEVADLADDVAPSIADPRSRVATGPFTGQSLSDVIAGTDDLMGPTLPTPDGRFPILVKILDARENLSVQVHPPAEYVNAHPDARLKTESWYVMGASDGAELFLDCEEAATDVDVAARVGTRAVVDLMTRVRAEVGAFHHVPAGLIHALGAGVMVAEIQTPSDTTFRIYDWGQEYGRDPRPLHGDEAIEAIRLHPEQAFSLQPATDPGRRLLAATEHYWIVEHRGPEVEWSAAPGPRVVMTMGGTVGLGDFELSRGGTAIVPASALDAPVRATHNSVVLEVGLPA